MSETKIAKYGDALRCLMTGDSTGKFNDPRQYTVFQNMLAEKRQGLDPKNLKTRSRSEVQICIASDENGDDENFFYIPDILILMLEVHKMNNAFSPRNNFPALPLDLNYLERLRVTESVTEAFNDWLATEQGQSDWLGFMRVIESTFHGNKTNSATRGNRITDYEHPFNEPRIAKSSLAALDVSNSKITTCAKSEMKKITPTKINDHPLAIFQTMGGLQFNEITLKLDPDNYVIRVSGRSKKATIQFASLGIMKKNQLRFTAPGELFFKMANDLFYPDQSDSSALGRLSKVLREAFNIPSPPFIEGKPEFKFDVPKDRQEKLKAEKGMRSYDDLVLSSQEKSTNDYFKEFDPNYDPNDEMYNDNKD